MSQLTPTAEAKRQSQVTKQANNLKGSLEMLHDRIGNLTDRLSSVLKSEVPKEKESEDKTELVILASTIQGFDDSVKSATSKIEDILDRLEL